MRGKHEVRREAVRREEAGLEEPRWENETIPAPSVSFRTKITVLLVTALISGMLLSYCIASSTMIYPFRSQLNCELGAIDIALKTTDQVKEQVSRLIQDYTYQIQTPDGTAYPVRLSDLTAEYNMEAINQQLNGLGKLFSCTDYKLLIGDDLVFDEAKIQALLDRIAADQGEAVASENACIVYDEAKQTFVIQPEKQGNIMVENAGQKLKEHLLSFGRDIHLLDAGCYVQPTVLHDDESLNNQLKLYNTYASHTIQYQIGDETEALSPARYYTWLGTAADGSVTVNDEQVQAYVDELSAKYNTYGRERAFTTSTGNEITLQNGDYGWVVNKSAMTADLIEKIKSQNAEPSDLIFAQYADRLWNGKDFGNSYVEISIDNQELWMYVNGNQIVDTPIVTGCVNNGHGTPRGIYYLKYKTRDAVLRGEDYASPVSYWMPFNGGIGMHDADWRSSFGGDIYLDSGSHGCVNIPPDKAKTIYENLENLMPIIVW